MIFFKFHFKSISLPSKLTETDCEPRFKPGIEHVIWDPVAVKTVQDWEPILTVNFVGSVPNWVPLNVIVAASETLVGDTEAIVGAIWDENVKSQFGEVQTAWTPLT